MLEWINWLRGLAILEVIAVHSSHNFLRGHMFDSPIAWAIILAIMSIARSCVPIFVMISGYLAILKYKNWRDFYGKKILRVIVPFVVWWLVYRLSKSYDYHFWFVYMIIPLYLLTPIFVWFVRKTNTMILGVLILVLFVSKIGGYAGYFLAGYLLAQLKFRQWQNLGAAIVAVTLLYAVTIISSIEKGALAEQYWDYLNPLTIIFSAALFSFFRNIDWPENNLIKNLAGNSYAIYLIHLLFLERLLVFGPPVLFLLTLCLSWLLVIILKKMPGGSFWVG